MAAVEETPSDENTATLPSLEDADFVRIHAAPTARAIAITAAIARLLDEFGTPFHLSIDPTPDPDEPHGSDTHLAIGTVVGEEADGWLSPMATTDTIESALPDPLPSSSRGLLAAIQWLDAATERSSDAVTLGLPTDNPADSLGMSTLVHGPFSGTVDSAREWLGSLGGSDDRNQRSGIALGCLGDHPTELMATVVARFLEANTLDDGIFATDAGTFDVLDVLAARNAGLAFAVACGQETAVPAALETWHQEAARVHEALRSGTLEESTHGPAIRRIDDAPVAPVARMTRFTTGARRPLIVTDGTTVTISGKGGHHRALLEAIGGAVDDVVSHGDGRISGTVSADTAAVERAIAEVDG